MYHETVIAGASSAAEDFGKGSSTCQAC